MTYYVTTQNFKVPGHAVVTVASGAVGALELEWTGVKQRLLLAILTSKAAAVDVAAAARHPHRDLSRLERLR